jgi:hypothetical protein
MKRWAESAVLWLDNHGLLTGLRWVTATVVVLIPTLSQFKVIESLWWLVPFGLGLVLLVPLESQRFGAALRQLMLRIGTINGSFGGTLDTLAQRFPLDRGPLTEEGCQMAVTSLLHRIRDYTAFALRVDSKPVLRATIAIPIFAPGKRDPSSLRVWTYDEPHLNRGYTEIPLYDDEGNQVPGAPRAYLTKDWEIIDDVRTLRVGRGFSVKDRPYRSILSMPLTVLDGIGRPLAVVNIDADKPNFFEPEVVVDKVLPLIAPVLTAIGLVLRMRQQGVPYVFPR